MALQYAGIQFDKVWGFRGARRQQLAGYDCCTCTTKTSRGQFSKFYLIYAGQPWLAEMVRSTRTQRSSWRRDRSPP